MNIDYIKLAYVILFVMLILTFILGNIFFLFSLNEVYLAWMWQSLGAISLATFALYITGIAR